MLRLLVVCCLLSAIIWQCKALGESCVLRTDDKRNVPGDCQEFKECTEVWRRNEDHGIRPQFCRNGRRQQIVCCPLPEIPTPRIILDRISAQSIF